MITTKTSLATLLFGAAALTLSSFTPFFGVTGVELPTPTHASSEAVQPDKSGSRGGSAAGAIAGSTLSGADPSPGDSDSPRRRYFW
ncbi:MAG: hypothetical protein AAF236_12675 [Verrucomicrobiota bacterium]